MSKVKCLVVKSSRGYVDGLKCVGQCLSEAWDFIRSGKISEIDFIVSTVSASAFFNFLYMMSMMNYIPNNRILTVAVCVTLYVFIIPILLVPLYSSVYECLNGGSYKCIITKSFKNYADSIKSLCVCIIEIIKFIVVGKLSKNGFCGMTCVISALSIIFYLISAVGSPESFLTFVIIMSLVLVLPLILVPIYGSVFICLVDENLKEIES
jgi:hypothetical protein